MSDWRCVRAGLVGVVREIGVRIDCDQKFTHAGVCIEAQLDDKTRVRLFTRRERGLRVRGRAKKSDFSEPFMFLIGTRIHFDEKENIFSKTIMNFPISPTTNLLRKPIEEILRKVFIDQTYKVRALR